MPLPHNEDVRGGEIFLYGILSFAVLAFGGTEHWAVTAVESFIGALFFSSLGAILNLRRRGGVQKQIMWTLVPAVGCIVLLASLQILDGQSLIGADIPWTASKSATWSSLIFWLCGALFVISASTIFRNRGAWQRFPWFIFLLGSLVSCLGLMQAGQGNLAYYGLRPVKLGNPFGPYVNYDHAANMMVLSAVMGLALLIDLLRRIPSARSVGFISDHISRSILTGFLLSVVVFGIWFTHSRGGGHSLLLATVALLTMDAHCLCGRRRQLTLYACVLAILFGYFAFVYLHPQWVGYVSGVLDNSTAYRLSMYRSSFVMFRDFPLFGVGLGAVRTMFPAYQEGMLHGIVLHVHNDWLEMLLQVGLVGVGIIIVNGVWLGVCLSRAWPYIAEKEKLLLHGGVAAAGAFLAHSVIEFNFHIPANALLFLALVAWVSEGARNIGSEVRVTLHHERVSI